MKLLIIILYFINVNYIHINPNINHLDEESKIDSILTEVKWLLYFRNNLIRKLTVKNIYKKKYPDFYKSELDIRIQSIELLSTNMYYIEVEYFINNINTKFFDENKIYNQPLLDIRKLFYSPIGHFLYTQNDARSNEICTLKTIPQNFSEMFEFIINNSSKLHPWFRLEAMKRGYLPMDYFYVIQEQIPWLEKVEK